MATFLFLYCGKLDLPNEGQIRLIKGLSSLTGYETKKLIDSPYFSQSDDQDVTDIISN